MEKENKFDKKKYDQQYIKDNYKRIVMNLRPHNIDLSEYVINTDK